MLPLGGRKDIGRRCEAWKHEMMVRVEELVSYPGTDAETFPAVGPRCILTAFDCDLENR